MTALLEAREHLKNFYSRFDVYIIPVLKFALAMITFMLINRNLGFMARLQNRGVLMIAALLCSFLPANVMIVFAAAFIVLNVYALSMECAIVVFALFMLMALLYFRFSPSDALAVLLTPVCFMLHIPYVVPLVCGLVCTPLSAISVGCGVAVYYVLDYVRVNSSVLGNIEAESAVQKFKYVIDNLLMSNRSMVAMAAAFAVTIILVYIIRRLSVDHSWTIATVVGAISCVVIVLVGDMTFDLGVSLSGVVFGGLVSAVITFVMQFFILSLDYSRTEHLQFEDDEYYYYVKAVPKMTVAAPEKKVKHINSQKKNTSSERTSSRTVSPERAKTPVRTSRPAVKPAERKPSGVGTVAQNTPPAAEGWRKKINSPTQTIEGIDN